MKKTILSALYILVLLVVLFIIDAGLVYFLDNVLFVGLSFFNKQHWIIKLICLGFGGYAILEAILAFLTGMSRVIGYYVFKWFPVNDSIVVVAYALAIINSICIIVMVWRVPKHYNFWIVVELLMISGFIWGLSSIVLVPDEVKKGGEV